MYHVFESLSCFAIEADLKRILYYWSNLDPEIPFGSEIVGTDYRVLRLKSNLERNLTLAERLGDSQADREGHFVALIRLPVNAYRWTHT
jgi:hypothetical protein